MSPKLPPPASESPSRACGERVPFAGLLFLTGALQAGARHRASARSPGIVVGPRVTWVQDTAVPSAQQVRWPPGGAPDNSDWANVRVACIWQDLPRRS